MTREVEIGRGARAAGRLLQAVDGRQPPSDVAVAIRLWRAGPAPPQVGAVLRGFENLHVAGAAAEVLSEPLHDLLAGRGRAGTQQSFNLDDHPGRAETAL